MTDAGAIDARPPDVGLPDVGPPDVGPPEVGLSDVSPSDLSPSDALDDDAICAQGCQLGTQAGCGMDEATCIATCRQEFATGICYPETRAAHLCVNAIGVNALTCMNGRTFVKKGICEPEKGALTTCLSNTVADASSD